MRHLESPRLTEVHDIDLKSVSALNNMKGKS